MDFIIFVFFVALIVLAIVKAAGPFDMGTHSSVGGSFSGNTAAPEGTIVLCGAGHDFVQIVGESHYQSALKTVKLQSVEIDGRLKFWAIIAPENDNPHDENAVVVKYGGQKLGYLSRDDAETFRDSHADVIGKNVPMAVRAILIGGTPGKPNMGVMLDFWLDAQELHETKPVYL